jgi:hypothetical protein
MSNRQIIIRFKNHQNVTNLRFCQPSIISKIIRKNKPIINQLIKQKTLFLARLTNFQFGIAFERQLSNDQKRSFT